MCKKVLQKHALRNKGTCPSVMPETKVTRLPSLDFEESHVCKPHWVCKCLQQSMLMQFNILLVMGTVWLDFAQSVSKNIVLREKEM